MRSKPFREKVAFYAGLVVITLFIGWAAAPFASELIGACR